MDQDKIRRQVEIISLVLSRPNHYSVLDFCDHFRVETPTINRDLRDIRTMGIPIHVVRKRLNITRELENREVLEMLSLYLSLSGSVIGYPKNTSLLVNKLGIRSLTTFVHLIQAIERERKIKIWYHKLYGNQKVDRIVDPYDIVPTFRDWRLIAFSDGIFKQFLIDNILDIDILEQSFRRDSSYDISDFYRYSFDFWTGSENYTVKLLFDTSASGFIKNTIWSEDQELFHREDGSLLLTLTVNSLEQIGDWVMSWGSEVKVIEPEELKDFVLWKAKKIIKNYH